MTQKFTHLQDDLTPQMVSVGDKQVTQREATAISEILLPTDLIVTLEDTGANHKGSILHTCVIAGIQAVKKTSEIIPLCHPLPVTGVDIQYNIDTESNKLSFQVTVKTDGKTGVEMEALHGASVCALTFYDMVKSTYKSLKISNVSLLEKKGGKSGHFKAEV